MAVFADTSRDHGTIQAGLGWIGALTWPRPTAPKPQPKVNLGRELVAPCSAMMMQTPRISDAALTDEL